MKQKNTKYQIENSNHEIQSIKYKTVNNLC